jgi:hypothetical protein
MQAEEDEASHQISVVSTAHQAVASIVSPCKSGSNKPESAEQNLTAPNAKTKHSQNNNDLPREVEDNHFDILDMVGGMEQMDGQTEGEFQAATNIMKERRDSAISTNLAFRHSPEMMIFPEVSLMLC